MNQEEFIKIIKKYSTMELIKFCSKLSIEMYNNKEPFKIETFPYYYKNGVKAGEHEFIYAQHEIVNLIYLSILYGNDYRKVKMDKNEFVNTLDKLKKYKNELSGKDKKIVERHQEFFAILFNEQIEFQKTNLSINRFNRICYIFDYINKKYKDHPEYIDFEEEVKKITGMSIAEYNEINLFITLLTVGSKNSDLTNMINTMELNLDKLSFNKENITDFINKNAKGYTFFRDEDNGTENWNNLKYSPLIKTDKDGHVLVANLFSFIISFSTRLYWLVRNKYKDLGSQKFTNYFGYCFEMYLEELLSFYKVKNYKKIQENQVEQPDWLIETKDYNFVIEQKATLFTLGSRETTLEKKYEEVEKFVRVIKKAMSQLAKYKVSNDKITLRICLTFEEVDGIEPIQELATKDLKVEDKELYWLVNISDFEKLVYLMQNNYDEFKKIIEKKIELEKTYDKNGRSFERILPYENHYVKSKLDYFKNISNDIVEKLRTNN